MKDVMNKKHKDWKKFFELLDGPEGCDFKDDGLGNNNSITWKCRGNSDKSKARSILKKHFPEIDIDVWFDCFEPKYPRLTPKLIKRKYGKSPAVYLDVWEVSEPKLSDLLPRRKWVVPHWVTTNTSTGLK